MTRPANWASIETTDEVEAGARSVGSEQPQTRPRPDLQGRRPRTTPQFVHALAATTTVGYGALFYAYGVLLLPMQQDLGWSRTFLSGVFSAALLVSAVLTVPIGRRLDRQPPRRLLLTAAVAAVAGMAGWAGAPNKVSFIAVWLVLGSCQAVLFYEPAFTIITKRLVGRPRNQAITAVTLVAGLASTIFGPLTAALEDLLGWRGAVLVLGAILGTVAIPCFARTFPRESTVARQSEQQASTADSEPNTSPADAFSSSAFRLLTFAYLLSTVTTFAVAVHLVPYLRGRGLDAQTAALALGAVGLLQVLGRSTFVRLSDGMSPLAIGSAALLAKGVGLGALLVVPNTAGLVSFVLIYGSANGIATLTRATSIAHLYGPAHYGTISSVIASICAVAGALAPVAAAAAIDLAGSDGPVLLTLAVLSMVAACASELVARTSRRLAAGEHRSTSVAA